MTTETAASGRVEPTETCLPYALRYAERGWHVLPLHGIEDDGSCTCGNLNCEARGKHPRTQHGLKDATTDETTIRAWWQAWPDANVAIRTGRESGVVVLDVDAKHGGFESLAQLEVPPTVVARTGGGGQHHFFAHPGDLVRNKIGLLPGIDVRGENGYVVAAPSRHASGGTYAWDLDNSKPIARPPQWLVSETERKAKDVAGPIPEGERSDVLLSLAGSMRRRGMTVDEIEIALLAVNENRCAPPLPRAEVKDLAARAGGWDAGEDKTWDDVWQAFPRWRGFVEKLTRSASGSSAVELPITASEFATQLQQLAAKHAEELAARSRFEWHTFDTLMRMDLRVNWLIKDLLADETYGMLAGEKKSQKTWLACEIALAIASGRPAFGTLEVVRPGQVLMLVGEGGMKFFAQRMMRLAEAKGIAWEEFVTLPFSFTFDVASSQSERFKDSLAETLALTKPVLVIIDPWYTYHGLDTEGTNLYQEGTKLAELQNLCLSNGASLLVVHHFKKGAGKDDLDKMAFAGIGEWVDSWLSVSHREPADPEGGEYKLTLRSGSRKWGGKAYDLDLSTGEFNSDEGLYDGTLAWTLAASTADDGESSGGAAASSEKLRADMIAAVRDEPGVSLRNLTSHPLLLGYRAAIKRDVLRQLVTEQEIVRKLVPYDDAAGRRRERDGYYWRGDS